MKNNEPQQGMPAMSQSDEAKHDDCAFCRHGFLGLLSHELRNPLSALSNSLYVLKNSKPDEARAVRALAVMDRQVRHLASLVDDLCDAATIGRGLVELHLVRLDLCEFLHNTAADHKSLFSGHGLKLREDIVQGCLFVSADPVRLGRILGNLLQNAAQFTPCDGEVALALRADFLAQSAIIQVRDSGVGLEPQMRDRLFLPFSQADTSLARSAGGLGLGLALAKGLVELHGGSIRAESAGLGMGSTFTIELPLREQPLRAGSATR
jgi:signal transduction histidine kinase